MNGKIAILLVAGFGLCFAGCSDGPPPPVEGQIAYSCGSTLNPSGTGESTPLDVHVYMLKSPLTFQSASGDDLYEDPNGALGGFLVGSAMPKQLYTNNTGTFPLYLDPGTENVGVAAFFNGGVQKLLFSREDFENSATQTIRFDGNSVTKVAAP